MLCSLLIALFANAGVHAVRYEEKTRPRPETLLPDEVKVPPALQAFEDRMKAQRAQAALEPRRQRRGETDNKGRIKPRVAGLPPTEAQPLWQPSMSRSSSVTSDVRRKKKTTQEHDVEPSFARNAKMSSDQPQYAVGSRVELINMQDARFTGQEGTIQCIDGLNYGVATDDGRMLRLEQGKVKLIKRSQIPASLHVRVHLAGQTVKLSSTLKPKYANKVGTLGCWDGFKYQVTIDGSPKQFHETEFVKTSGSGFAEPGAQTGAAAGQRPTSRIGREPEEQESGSKAGAAPTGRLPPLNRVNSLPSIVRPNTDSYKSPEEIRMMDESKMIEHFTKLIQAAVTPEAKQKTWRAALLIVHPDKVAQVLPDAEPERIAILENVAKWLNTVKDNDFII